MTFFYQEIESPIGSLYIATDTKNLRILAMDANWDTLISKFPNATRKNHAILTKTQNQIEEYFSKKRTQFDIPVHYEGTVFQIATWNALAKIPYGETRSYSEQAQNIGNPKAVRAIGRTNGLNPISIIVPCHRVIGKSGSLTGYASGLKNKKFLLELEHSLKYP